jgi:DNA-binding CsgD family transcriptional regulator
MPAARTDRRTRRLTSRSRWSAWTCKPSTRRCVLRLFRNHVRPRADYGVTDREREILHLLIEDYTQKAIAAGLYISSHTVDIHLRNIYAKLQVHSRSGAIVKALRERLLQGVRRSPV